MASFVAEGAEGLPMPRRIVAAFALCCTAALVVIDGSIATVALPTIARDLGVEESATVLVIIVYQLVLVSALLPLSALGDRVGHRRMLNYGLLIFSTGAALCFFVRSLPLLLAIRAIQAAGAAAVLGVAAALLREIYPSNQLGRGLSLNNMVGASAGALAPTLGGLVLAVAPWPWVFALAAPLGLLALLLSRSLPYSEPHDEPYDIPGALLCMLTFGLTIGGLQAVVHGHSPLLALVIIAIGLLTGLLFVRRELGTDRPTMPLDLLARPVIGLSSLAAVIAFVGIMTLLISLPFRLQHAHGYAPSEVGGVIAGVPLAMLFTAPISGMLSDRFPAHLLGGIGLAIVTGACLSFAFLPADPDFSDLIIRTITLGLGFSLFWAPNARLVIGEAPRERAAAAGGLISANRLVGQMLGATAAATLLALGLGDGSVPALAASLFAAAAGILIAVQGKQEFHLGPKAEVPDL